MTLLTATAQRALSLYRAIWRASRGMPTLRRTTYVRDKLREEYEQSRKETNPDKVSFALSYAELQLETIKIQAKSLSALHCDPLYHNQREI